MYVCVVAPLLSVEEGEDVFAGHEALLHVTQFQVVHLEHVLLLFLLQGEGKRRAGLNLGIWEMPKFYLFIFGSRFSCLIATWMDCGLSEEEYSHSCCLMIPLCSSLKKIMFFIFFSLQKKVSENTSNWDKRNKRKEDKMISGG